jgi:transcriptional regulator with GAF, ATPase, and Fis domain
VFPIPKVAVLLGIDGDELASVVASLRAIWGESFLIGLLRERHNSVPGLDDLMCAPFSDWELRWRIERAMAGHDPYLGRQAEADFKRSHHLESLIGESPAFMDVLRRIPVLGGSDATVLIGGETGTGKELVARALHYCGPRAGRPFVPVNCGALPDSLAENELFGHERGAYTGAVVSEKGLLAVADGGTLFLDEVDSLTLAGQVKLLRFLQDREYRPLGSTTSRTANVRVLAASNGRLSKLVESGRFREDLYYRLNGLFLCLPPLRERAADIPVLARHFLLTYRNRFQRRDLQFSAEALATLESYVWPGNVRELESVVQRAALLSLGPLIASRDLQLSVSEPSSHPESESFHEAKCKAVERFERDYISRLLSRFDGNITQSARAAGKERRALQRLIQKHGLCRQQFQH